MPTPKPTGSDPIKIEFVQRDTYSLDDYAAMIPTPPDGGPLDNIWDYDGTGGLDNRPAMVREDDERIARGEA